MEAEAMRNAARRSCSFLVSVMLCLQLLLHQTQAFKVRVAYGEEEEKVPLSVIVPDPTPPELSSLTPLAAPPPLSGGGDDDDVRPKLPTERRRWHREARRAAHAPAPGPARAEAPAPGPGKSGGAALIRSSPAVPVPRGVTDTATILPMPAPGENRQDVGAATASTGAVGTVLPLLMLMLGLTMMASFGLY